jgi:ADP-heptose:LPS heptosyltransferase
MERLEYRLKRNLKDFVWFLDYLSWLIFSPYKFTRIPEIKSVLVVEDIGIGDLLVCTPVFRALKKKYGKVDVLVKKGVEDVLFGNPNVDNVITSVERDYDLGVILHARTNGNYKMSKMLKKHCRFRIGCCRVGLKEGKGFFMNRKTFPTFWIKPKMEDNLDVIRAIGVDEEDTHLEAYTDFTPKLKNYVVFHTHGAYETHNWKKEKWAELGDKLGKTIVFTGTEKSYVKEIISKMNNKKTIDATSSTIKQYFGWIKNSDYVVTVDTSAMHVAAAFDKKVISLFGAGDPRAWKPNSSVSIVIRKGDCHSCHLTECKLKDHRCMNLIEAEDVLKEIKA